MKRCPNPHPHPDYADAVAITRFWSLVKKTEPGNCWLWQGDTNHNGYGVFVYQGRKHPAHELALSFTTGEKRLDALDTCHVCDNPPCCNPTHLRFDTRLSNVREMYERGRAARPGRLTDEQVVLMRERRAAGALQKDLARDFGITDGQVSLIIRGLRWKDVGGPIETKRQYRRAA